MYLDHLVIIKSKLIVTLDLYDIHQTYLIRLLSLILIMFSLQIICFNQIAK
jgi:hypothetical protein